MKLKCLMCGKEFDGPSDAIHCPGCVKIIKNTHYHPRTCKSCGAHFLGGGRASYCPACRAERQKKQKSEYEARKRAGTVRRLGSIDHCAICGKPYTVEGGLQRYCPECAPAAVGTIALEQAREYAKKHFLERAENRKMARQEALAIFRTLTKEEQLTYLSRLRALADTPAPAPAPPGEAPGTTA